MDVSAALLLLARADGDYRAFHRLHQGEDPHHYPISRNSEKSVPYYHHKKYYHHKAKNLLELFLKKIRHFTTQRHHTEEDREDLREYFGHCFVYSELNSAVLGNSE